MKKKFLNWGSWAGLGVMLIALDLFTKWIAETHPFSSPFVIIPGIFQFTPAYHNTGVAFSIPIPNWIMIIVTPLLIGVVALIIARTCDLTKTLTKLCLILIISGAVGNLLNRVLIGSVIDMIQVSIWPIFNLADSYLTTGIFLILVFYGRISLKNP